MWHETHTMGTRDVALRLCVRVAYGGSVNQSGGVCAGGGKWAKGCANRAVRPCGLVVPRLPVL